MSEHETEEWTILDWFGPGAPEIIAAFDKCSMAYPDAQKSLAISQLYARELHRLPPAERLNLRIVTDASFGLYQDGTLAPARMEP